MKKSILFFLITFISLSCYSQIIFEKGYYINNSNQKVNCLIKNFDWINNPLEFEYKLTEISERQKATINTIKEFGVNSIFKYTRHTVNIDKSSNDLREISNIKAPIFNEETLFLKVLIEGEASLYSFENDGINRYFYKINDSKVNQLVFKEYLNDEGLVAKNTSYKQQLWSNLKCSSIKTNNFERLNYNKEDLTNFFVEYNKCSNKDYILYEKVNEKKDLFNLSIRPGINSSTLSIRNDLGRTNGNFDNKLNFRFGIEAEFIFSFNKNKWAFIIEPTYNHSYKAENNIIRRGAEVVTKVEYHSLELPIGIRYYFFLNEDSKFFINASYVSDFTLSNGFVDFNSEVDLEITAGNNLAFGAGYKHNDKYSLELRYSNRDVLGSYASWDSKYKVLSVIFGYSFF